MTRLHHTIAGDGPPVVFLHAFPLDSRMWTAQVEALSKKHYTCVSVDLSGFGRSSTDAPVHAIDDHAYDVHELLNVLHLDKVHLVGQSMGGYVALSFAGRYSQRLASLTLASSKATADSNEQSAARDQGIAMVESKGPGAFLDGLLPKLLSPKAPAGLIAQVRQVAEAQPQATLSAALAAMRDRSDSTEILRALEVPCLLISAAQDVIAPPDIARDMKKTQPDADLVELAACGHLSALEAPQAFNAALTKFFESLRH